MLHWTILFVDVDHAEHADRCIVPLQFLLSKSWRHTYKIEQDDFLLATK